MHSSNIRPIAKLPPLKLRDFMNDILIPVQQLITKLQRDNEKLRSHSSLNETEKAVIKAFLHNSPQAENGLYKEERHGLTIKQCDELKRKFMDSLV